MSQLAKQRIVHRDLAAFEHMSIMRYVVFLPRGLDGQHNDVYGRRNVLLTAQNVCKISDFGLARDVYEDCLC